MKILLIITTLLLALITIGIYLYLKKFVKEHGDDVFETYAAKILLLINILTAVFVSEIIIVVALRIFT